MRLKFDSIFRRDGMKSSLLIALGTVVVTVGCATTRVVSKQPRKGGVIALQKGLWGEDEARAKMESTMRSNCGGQYEITDESEVVVGQVSRTKGSEQGKQKNGYVSYSTKQSESTTETNNKTEWRITYACKR